MDPRGHRRVPLFKLPELLNIVLPVSLLLALLYALTQHSRYNELIATRGGIEPLRICAPFPARSPVLRGAVR